MVTLPRTKNQKAAVAPTPPGPGAPATILPRCADRRRQFYDTIDAGFPTNGQPHRRTLTSTPLMDLAALLEAIASPVAYPHVVAAVELRQTHLSVVALAGPLAYK